MSNFLQNPTRCVPKHSKCTLSLIFILGSVVVLFYYGIPLSQKLFELLNNNVNDSKPLNLSLNTTVDSTLPTMCIVTRIYWAQITYFPVFALALYHSGLHNIRIYVVNTDRLTNIRQLKQAIKFINGFVLRPDFVILLDLGEPPVAKDYGYGMTDRVIAYLYKQDMNSSSGCQYVTFTNADNFYSRRFGEKILPYMKAEKDVIGWGFVSHHRWPGLIDKTKSTIPEIVDDGTEKCIAMELRTNAADLGAVAYRLSFLRKHNLYFRRPNGAYTFGSDGYFVEEAVKRTSASVILRQTLFVHQ